jgi:spermidine synthase
MPVAVAVAGTAGFVALSYEILWYRVYSFFTWSSAATFGVLLAVYLLGVALGSWASRVFCRSRPTAGEAKELAPLAAFFLAANTLSFLVVPILARTLAASNGALAIIAVAAGAMGAVLPLASHFAIAPDDRAGAKLSYLYVANIVGSAAGSLLTGFVLLDAFPLARACLVISIVGYVTCAGLFIAARRWVAGGVGLTAGLACFAIFGSAKLFDRVWERMYFKEKFEEDDRFAYVVENKHGVIAVTTDGTVLGGGAYDGRISTSLVDDRNGIVRAYAIGAVHPRPRDILMVGLASGGWAQVLVHHPETEHLTAIEINDGYLDVIRRHEAVKSLLENPKFSVEIDDGRRWLQRHPNRKFDLIVMNTTWNWRAHSTNLLSNEFMQLVRRHLLEGGIFFFNTTSSPDAKKTALSAYPYGMRIYNFIAVSDSPMTLDKGRWRDLLMRWQIDGVPVIDTNDAHVRAELPRIIGYLDTFDRPPIPEGMEPRESVLASVQDARIITDDNMVTEFIEPLHRMPPL